MPLLSDPQNQMTGLQWSALRGFFSSPLSAQFFLTGGTALAGFYFGHRTSVDLDFEELLKDAKKKDLGVADFHLGMIFLNPPPTNSFPATTPAVKPETIIGFFKRLGKKLVARSEKPRYG